jgi:hypothetical protein
MAAPLMHQGTEIRLAHEPGDFGRGRDNAGTERRRRHDVE